MIKEEIFATSEWKSIFSKNMSTLLLKINDIRKSYINVPIRVLEVEWPTHVITQSGLMPTYLPKVKRYEEVDLSEFLQDWESWKWLELLDYSKIQYYIARKFGCNQIESRIYAHTTICLNSFPEITSL